MESLSLPKLKKVAQELDIKDAAKKDRNSLINSIKRSKNKDDVIIDLCSIFKTEVLSLPENGSIKSIKGARDYMEDTYVVAHKGLIKLYGVFDGHSGKQVSTYLKRYLPNRLFKAVCNTDLSPTNVVTAIQKVYKQIDLDIMKKDFKGDPGSTAVVAMLIKDRIYFINVGDSRGLLLNKDKILYKTADHKPNLKKEKERIETFGGKVTYDDVPRVSYPMSNKELAMSRAFGDIDYKINKKREYLGEKAPVIVNPTIKVIKLTPHINYTIVLGSDGVWDVMSNKVVTNTTNKLKHKAAVEQISKKSLDSGDNITVLITHIKVKQPSAKPTTTTKPKPKAKSPKRTLK